MSNIAYGKNILDSNAEFYKFIGPMVWLLDLQRFELSVSYYLNPF